MKESKSDKLIQLLAIFVVVILAIIGYIMNFKPFKGIVFTDKTTRAHYKLERFAGYSHNITQAKMGYKNGYYLLVGESRFNTNHFVTVFKDNEIVRDESISVLNFSKNNSFYSWNQGKLKFYDYADENLSTEEYEELSYIKDDLFIAKQDGKSGVITKNGNVVLPFEYGSINSSVMNIEFSNNRVGNTDLREAIVTDYLWASKNEKYGVINLKGEVIVPFEYDFHFTKIVEDEKIVAFIFSKDSKNYVFQSNGKLVLESNDKIVYYLNKLVVVKENQNADFYSLDGAFIKSIQRDENWKTFFEDVNPDTFAANSQVFVIPDKTSPSIAYLIDKDLNIKKIENLHYDSYDGMTTDYVYYATDNFYVLEEDGKFNFYNFKTDKLVDSYASSYLYRDYAILFCKRNNQSCAIYDLEKDKFVTTFKYEYIPYHHTYFGDIGYLKSDNQYILFMDYEHELTCDVDVDVSLLAGGISRGNIYKTSNNVLYDKNCQKISEDEIRNYYVLDNDYIIAEELNRFITINLTDYYTYQIFNSHHNMITYDNEDAVSIILYLGFVNNRLFFLTDNGIYTINVG